MTSNNPDRKKTQFSYSARNAEGCTPFMQSLCGRAYPASLLIMDSAKQLALRPGSEDVEKDVLMSMLYPSGSSLDNSPINTLCCNDTCSFTWTGDEHINQVSNVLTGNVC